jgi:F-type H+-transporting ATPase subunit epsilon
MAQQLTFELVTPAGQAFSEDVYEVLLPTESGQIAILPHHMDIVSVAVAGVISIRLRESDKDGAMEHFATNGGIIEVQDGTIRLLADEVERADNVDEMKAKEALARAQAMRASADDQISISEAEAIIEHSMARLKVADLKRRKNRY